MSCFSAKATATSSSSSTEEEKECCICYECIGTKNNCITPCGHSFCFSCVTMALTRNNSCPICRTVLIETPAVEEDADSEDDSDYGDEDSDVDSEGDSEGENEEDDEGIEEITERFLKLGYTAMDIMSLMTGRYKRSDPKNTKEYIKKMIAEFEKIIDEVDKEEEERERMSEEDKSTTGASIAVSA